MAASEEGKDALLIEETAAGKPTHSAILLPAICRELVELRRRVRHLEITAAPAVHISELRKQIEAVYQVATKKKVGG